MFLYISNKGGKTGPWNTAGPSHAKAVLCPHFFSFHVFLQKQSYQLCLILRSGLFKISFKFQTTVLGCCWRTEGGLCKYIFCNSPYREIFHFSTLNNLQSRLLFNAECSTLILHIASLLYNLPDLGCCLFLDNSSEALPTSWNSWGSPLSSTCNGC